MKQELIHKIAKELISEGWTYKDFDSPDFDTSEFNNDIVYALDCYFSFSSQLYYEMEAISKKLDEN